MYPKPENVGYYHKFFPTARSAGRLDGCAGLKKSPPERKVCVSGIPSTRVGRQHPFFDNEDSFLSW